MSVLQEWPKYTIPLCTRLFWSEKDGEKCTKASAKPTAGHRIIRIGTKQQTASSRMAGGPRSCARLGTMKPHTNTAQPCCVHPSQPACLPSTCCAALSPIPGGATRIHNTTEADLQVEEGGGARSGGPRHLGAELPASTPHQHTPKTKFSRDRHHVSAEQPDTGFIILCCPRAHHTWQ